MAPELDHTPPPVSSLPFTKNCVIVYPVNIVQKEKQRHAIRQYFQKI